MPLLTKALAIKLLKGAAYWILLFIGRNIFYGLVIGFHLREKMDSVIAIAPFFWTDTLDIVFYFFSGILLAAIFRTGTLFLAVEVWIIEVVFWLIAARPFVDLGIADKGIFPSPYTPIANALASYVIGPACIILGAAAGLKILSVLGRYRRSGDCGSA